MTKNSSKVIDKQKIVDILVSSGILKEGFTGRITINLNQGGISEIERVEKLK